MKKLTGLVLLVLVLAVWGSMTMQAASTIKELEKQQNELKQNIQSGENTVKAIEGQITDINQNINQIESQMHSVSATIGKLDKDLASKEKEVLSNEARIADLEQRQETYYRQARERIQVMYEYGSTEYIEVLLSSQDATDFFTRMEYLNRILEFDSSLFSEMEAVRDELLETKAKIEREQKQLESMKLQQEKERQNMEVLVKAKSSEMRKIEQSKEALLKEIQMWKDEQKSLDTRIKKLIEQSKLTYAGGKVNWPVPGYYTISSPFGKRIHPVHGYESFHTGVDIPAPGGTKIVAVADGKVIYAGTSPAWGKYILINHGSGWVTQYAHCSQMNVKEGDTVKQGQTIGRVGSTGWSTGNHLHYGVQINGVWVNPLNNTKTR
ncbi:murein hydrolase activator EnvC family protein [Anaerotalea alkaliphila]|uniref:Peptidoglycan DD-metalloendopeptidase family protein n=1 Tax=Anaerotalea alkaliphila TaxID=2662126 RepID=A0A7X5KP76_9FIRM|nr:M23 family metallopeptidase [Anaerotalea alkaliphila]NDL67652.1 peptidoglycan DD-metalloendopeptidase family protein [Anaerotalea alkaliphila]